MSFNDLMDSSTAGTPPEEIAPDTRVTGRVAKIHREDIFVDLPGRSQGVVSVRQFEEPPVEGAELELVVVKFNADEGLYELSRPHAAVSVGNWEDVEEGQVVDVTVTGSNKGGLECQIAGLKGFIPLGQLSMYRVEHPEDYVGQRLACVVTEANRDRRNLVLSHRAVMEREREEKRGKLLEELEVGQLREGVVRSIKDFGAFVDLDGADGLIHVSQLSWDRVNHPSEVLEIGQKVKVRVEKFDKDTGKISLTYREVGENPWDKAASKYYVGARVSGVISKLMDFGAFVKLEPGVEGLVHVSELSYNRVWRPSDVVSEGQEVEVKVLSVDAEKQRISLSVKALADRPAKAGKEQGCRRRHAAPGRCPQGTAEAKRAAQGRDRRAEWRGEVWAELVIYRGTKTGFDAISPQGIMECHYSGQRAEISMETLIADPRLSQRLIDERRARGIDRFDEVWEGVYVMAPAPNDEHQEIELRIARRLLESRGRCRTEEWTLWATPRSNLAIDHRQLGSTALAAFRTLRAFLKRLTGRIGHDPYWSGAVHGPDFVVRKYMRKSAMC